MSRRSFLAATAAAAACLRAGAPARALAGVPHSAPLRFHPGQPGPAIPHNFVGLSYEAQQLSEPSFFSAANSGLVAQFRALAPHGVLRLGGNTSDYSFWKPTSAATPPWRPQRPYKVGDPPPDLSYALTPEAIHNLRAFLDATGWTCLYGINLGTNTPTLAAAEAEFAARVLGAKLEYFQVGNEADRFGSTLRDPKTWSVDAYLDEWLTFATAILARVPGARFGMPDTSNTNWFARIGDRLASDPIRPRVACLSHHHYVGGPPSDPTLTIERILKPDPKLVQVAGVMRAAASKLGAPWRMTEGNTCYRGGKPGVSDVFAASLWAADYMLTLASLSYAGVNLHGGDGQMVANSLGGKLPGDDLVTGDPAGHPHPYYTPIAHIGSRYIAEPVSYGMRFMQRFAGTQLIAIDFDPGPVNATAYAARRPGENSAGEHVLVAIINKDATQDLSVSLPRPPSAIEITSAESLAATDVRVQHATPATGIHATGVDQSVPPHSMAIFAVDL